MNTLLVASLLFLAACYDCSAQEEWQAIKQELVFSNPPFKECHASTIVELSSGSVMAAWFGGTGEGAKDVCIWAAVNKSGKWSNPTRLATGIINASLRYPCWNPVLFKLSNGKLLLFYKVGPSPQKWWGMMMASANDGETWSAPVKLPDGILGPIKNKPYQLPDGSLLSPSSEETQYKWSVHLERSTDNGASWQKIPIDTAGFDVIQPSILHYGNGRLQILCRSKQGAVVQSWSDNDGKSWEKLSKTELLNPNSGTDAVTLKNGEQLIVYNPDVPGKVWFNGRAKLHVAISKDGNKWRDIFTLENGTKEEFSYPAVIQTKDGRVHISYTYDRKNIKYVILQPKS